MLPVEIDAAIEAARPLAYYETDLPDLPLSRLRDRTFEILAHALAEAEVGTDSCRYTRATLLREGADEGRDIVLLKGEQVVGVIQCKCYSSTITLPMVLQELLRFTLLTLRKPTLAPEPDKFSYSLWTAGEIAGTAITFFNAPRAYLKANRDVALEQARKARAGVVALSEIDPRIAEGENEAAINLLARFDLSTVGPTEIRARLADDERVRRRFFRAPSDRQLRADEVDVERLMIGLRREHAQRQPRGAPYVPRATLDQEFSNFMASPAQIFTVVGGSGQGKSSWVHSIVENPPPAIRVDVVRGDDIRPEDDNIADTLARLLRGRRLGEVTGVDLVQGVLEWFDGATHLLIVDGLDRVPIAAMPTLHGWLQSSLALTASTPTRFVITSRPVTWSVIKPDIKVGPGVLHLPAVVDPASASASSVVLGLLAPDEVAAFYEAYGIAAKALPSRPFRVPGLIQRQAHLRRDVGLSIGTRTAVMAQSVADLGRELHRNAQIGQQQFARLVEVLGDQLVEAREGLLSARRLRGETPDILPALDAAIGADMARVDDDDLRIEPDDLVEYLMALQLDTVTAKKLLDQHGGDFLIGATGMVVALLEQTNPNCVEAAIAHLLDGATFDGAALAAAAHSITELSDTDRIREHLGTVIAFWRMPNILLSRSPMVGLLAEVNLPPVERLGFALRLAGGEDVWDWRAKYFTQSFQAASRKVTGFGRAAARAVEDDPEAAMDLLLPLLDECEDKDESVASGLVYLAINGAPAPAARRAWGRRQSDGGWLLNRVMSIEPEAVAEMLGDKAIFETAMDEAVERLWTLTYDPPADRHEDRAFRTVVSRSASALLPFATSNAAIVRLLVAKLLGEPDDDSENRLAAFWSHLDSETFWLAVRARSGNRPALFAEMVTGHLPERSRSWLLEMMPADLFPREDWSEISTYLEGAAANGMDKAAALALESLLYRAQGLDALGDLMPIALRFAASANPDVRRMLTFFAGSPAEDRSLRALASCDTLFAALIEHEDGGNLPVTVWKLLQSAFERGPTAIYRLNALTQVCGVEAVDELIAETRIAEPAGFAFVRNQWLALAATKRPSFKAFAGVR